MTFDQLLGLDSKSLALLSDQELEHILGPCLVNVPPVDIQILQKDKQRLDLEKQKLKDEKKKEKQEQKLIELASQPEPSTPKKLSKSSRASMADMIKLLGEKIEKI